MRRHIQRQAQLPLLARLFAVLLWKLLLRLRLLLLGAGAAAVDAAAAAAARPAASGDGGLLCRCPRRRLLQCLLLRRAELGDARIQPLGKVPVESAKRCVC